MYYSRACVLLPLHLFVKHKSYSLFYLYFTFYPFIRYTSLSHTLLPSCSDLHFMVYVAFLQYIP